MGGEKIIPAAIIWQSDPNEIEEVESLEIKIKYPPEYGNPDPIVIGKMKKNVFKIKNIDNEDWSDSPPKDGWYKVELGKSYKNVDCLKVIIDAVYTVSATHFLYWLMLYPTKDFNLTLKFPDSYSAQVATFINHAHVGEITQEEGYYSFSCNFWMIPQSGVAWRLLPAKKHESDA